jgi:hypothetical protein
MKTTLSWWMNVAGNITLYSCLHAKWPFIFPILTNLGFSLHLNFPVSHFTNIHPLGTAHMMPTDEWMDRRPEWRYWAVFVTMQMCLWTYKRWSRLSQMPWIHTGVRDAATIFLTLGTMFIRGKLHALAALPQAQYPIHSRKGGTQSMPRQFLCLYTYHGILIRWISRAPLLMKFI